MFDIILFQPEFANIKIHENWEDCLIDLQDRRIFAVSTKGTQHHHIPSYLAGDAFLFGAESSGLKTEIRESFPAERCIRVPMVPGSRSLNLSNTVSVVIYEAWRQTGFGGAI